MNLLTKTSLLTLSLAATLLLNQCAAEDSSDGDNRINITIPFAARVNDADFSCATTGFSGVGTANSGGGSEIGPRDFRFYVHDVVLLTDQNEELGLKLVQDGEWQYRNVALLDFEDATGGCTNTTGPTAATNSVLQGSIRKPKGTINGIKFRVGVPVALNHNDRAAAPAPLNVAALHWNWTTGYKHARLDFTAADFGGTGNLFNLHLGSVDCTGDGVAGTANCTTENQPQVQLDYRQGQTILADLGALLADTDLSVANQSGPAGCMSGRNDPECKAIFGNLGLDFLYSGTALRGLEDGSSEPIHYASATQSFFRVENDE